MEIDGRVEIDSGVELDGRVEIDEVRWKQMMWGVDPGVFEVVKGRLEWVSNGRKSWESR